MPTQTSTFRLQGNPSSTFQQRIFLLFKTTQNNRNARVFRDAGKEVQGDESMLGHIRGKAVTIVDFLHGKTFIFLSGAMQGRRSLKRGVQRCRGGIVQYAGRRLNVTEESGRRTSGHFFLFLQDWVMLSSFTIWLLRDRQNTQRRSEVRGGGGTKTTGYYAIHSERQKRERNYAI